MHSNTDKKGFKRGVSRTISNEDTHGLDNGTTKLEGLPPQREKN